MVWHGKRVLVMGLGRHTGGVAAARYLARQGAIVAISDSATADALAASRDSLSDVPIALWEFGGHTAAAVEGAEVVVVNPGVRPDSPWIAAVRTRGVQISSEIELFLAACPARVVGVTGSNGKSSTAAMLAEIASSATKRVWLGGNIERSLLRELDEIHADDVVILELSSFQLYWLNEGARWPDLAIFTGFAPNHLDWHRTLEHYRRAKLRLLAHAKYVVADAFDPALAQSVAALGGRLCSPWPLAKVPPLAIAGEHQRRNAALAAAAAEKLKLQADAIQQGLSRFRGLPHRLECLGERLGRTFYDDSQATTPESTIAALDALPEGGWWLLGGADKGSDLRAMSGAIARRGAGAACFGATGARIHAFLVEAGAGDRAGCLATLDDALLWCVQRSNPGDTIVLSCGAASTDQFRDYAHRANTFRAAIDALGDSVPTARGGEELLHDRPASG